MKSCLLNAQSVISLQQRLKLLNFLSLHSPDLVFVTETCSYPEIEDSEVCPLKCNYSIIARQDRSGGEHSGVLVAAKKDFCFNYSDLTQKIGRNMKIGQKNDFAVTISNTTIQGFHLFLFFTIHHRHLHIESKRTFWLIGSRRVMLNLKSIISALSPF